MQLFGYCVYFERIGKQAKEIPQEIVDVGCKFHETKQEDVHGQGSDNDRGLAERKGSDGVRAEF